MNYQKIYNDLIQSRKINPTKSDYYETHHILPKSMGGDNSKDNLVKLTAREHFIAHWLLWRIHKNKQMAHAFFGMRRANNGNQKENKYINSYGYNESRKAHSQKTSEQFKNRTSPMKNKKHTDESKNKMSLSRTGNLNFFYGKSHTEETKRLIGLKSKDRKTFLGKKHSLETIEKISNAKKGCIGFNKGKPMKEETKQKLSISKMGKLKGEKNPMFGVKKEQIECEYCKKVIDISNYKRWHGERCKYR